MSTIIKGRHRRSFWLGTGPALTLVSMLAVLLVLTACGGTTAEPTADIETAAPAAEPVAEQTTEPEPEPEPEPEQEYGGFAEDSGFTWDDGLVVFLTGLEEFTPSEWAAFDDAPAYVRFTITVLNESDAPFDPSGFIDTMQSGGSEASSVFDTDQGLDGSPMTTVLPGKSVSWDVGYGVADPSDLVAEITPGWDYESALFIGGL